MKRLITVILILAMLLPASALAADPDPIVGSWYMFFDVQKNPEMETLFQEFDRCYIIYTFSDAGIVYCLENDVKDNTGTPSYATAGKWEKTGTTYSVSLIGYGTGNAYIKENELFSELYGIEDFYFRLRKLIAFDMYNDFAR